MRSGRFIVGFGIFIMVAISGAFSASAREIGADRELSDLILVKSGEGKAVVRFGAGRLEVIGIGDKVGRHQAEVKEIGAGRLVLEELFTGKDGRPNRAEVILKEGKQGGERYLARPEEAPPPSTRSLMIVPKGQQEGK